MPLKDLTGVRFGKLTVLGYSGRVYAPNGNRYVNVLCDCGVTKEVQLASLKAKKNPTSSCGCGQGFYTHGESANPLYPIWNAMKQRCNNPRDTSYANYGGRGISVCPEWEESFVAFLEDMGPRPEGDYLLDRENNSLGYCKSNCRWVTRAESNRNTRANVFVEYEGRQVCLAELSKLVVGVSYSTLVTRHYEGIPISKLIAPTGERGNQKTPIRVTLEGIAYTLYEALEKTGNLVSYQTARRRLLAGISVEAALTKTTYGITR